MATALTLSVVVAVGIATEPFTKVNVADAVSAALVDKEVAVAFIHPVNEVAVAFAPSAGTVTLE